MAAALPITNLLLPVPAGRQCRRKLWDVLLKLADLHAAVMALLEGQAHEGVMVRASMRCQRCLHKKGCKGACRRA